MNSNTLTIKHVAIIMDGNRRWASKNKKPTTYGHKVGAEQIKQITISALDNKVKFLTLFAFSTENWNRSKNEVNFLLKLFESVLKQDQKIIDWCNTNQIRLSWIGFKKGLSKFILSKILLLENATKDNQRLVLTIAFNYGGLQDILQASKQMNAQSELKDLKSALLTSKLPPVDLLIRTGNETRISNFLIFDLAYAEIIFEKTLWPDYSKTIFKKNLNDFYKKHRRFGV